MAQTRHDRQHIDPNNQPQALTLTEILTVIGVVVFATVSIMIISGAFSELFAAQ